MKKNVLLGLLLILGAARALAASPVSNYGQPSALPAEAAVVYTTVKSSVTYQAMNLSVGVPAAVVKDQTQQFRWVEVQNFDSASPIVCGENSTTLNVTAGSFVGYVIAAWSGNTAAVPSKKFDIPPGSTFACETTKTVTGLTAIGLSWGR
jgi:hypothetical protein